GEEPTITPESFTDTVDIILPAAPAAAESTPRLTPPSRIAFPGNVSTAPAPKPSVVAKKSGVGRAFLRFFIFLLFVVGVAGAFYAGMVFQRQRLFTAANPDTQPSPSPQESNFVSRRAAVDADPQKWMTEGVQNQLTKE